MIRIGSAVTQQYFSEPFPQTAGWRMGLVDISTQMNKVLQANQNPASSESNLPTSTSGSSLFFEGPGHQLANARCWPQVDELCQHVRHPRQRFDRIQFTGLNQRGDHHPALGAEVVTGE